MDCTGPWATYQVSYQTRFYVAYSVTLASTQHTSDLWLNRKAVVYVVELERVAETLSYPILYGANRTLVTVSWASMSLAHASFSCCTLSMSLVSYALAAASRFCCIALSMRFSVAFIM